MLMGLEPVVAKARVSDKGYSHVEGVLHLFQDDAFYLFFLVRIDGEVEFVVDLENHLGANVLSLEALEDVDHRYLDDVCSCALNGGIDGITLGKASHHTIGRVDVRQVATTSE